METTLDIISHPLEWLLPQNQKPKTRNQNMTSVEEDTEKLEHLCTVGGN